MLKRINCIFVSIPESFTINRNLDFIIRIISLIYTTMDSNIFKKLQNLSFFSISIFLIFSLQPISSRSMALNNSSNSIKKQMSIVITKNTTQSELEKIKKDMLVKGLKFNYSNVVYNEKSEITAISIQYKDANNNAGKYSVSSDSPINNIIITSNDNGISIKTEGSGNQSFTTQRNGDNRSADIDELRKERNEAIKLRKSKMETRMEDRKKSMEERRAQMENEIKMRRDSMLNESPKTSSMKFNGNPHIIKESTTDSELEKLENTYASENITFSYHNLKRNDSGLITNISVTVDNRKGSVSTSEFGNGTDPIKNISLSVDQQHTIMKSAE